RGADGGEQFVALAVGQIHLADHELGTVLGDRLQRVDPERSPDHVIASPVEQRGEGRREVRIRVDDDDQRVALAHTRAPYSMRERESRRLTSYLRLFRGCVTALRPRRCNSPSKSS